MFRRGVADVMHAGYAQEFIDMEKVCYIVV